MIVHYQNGMFTWVYFVMLQMIVCDGFVPLDY